MGIQFTIRVTHVKSVGEPRGYLLWVRHPASIFDPRSKSYIVQFQYITILDCGSSAVHEIKTKRSFRSLSMISHQNTIRQLIVWPVPSSRLIISQTRVSKHIT